MLEEGVQGVVGTAFAEQGEEGIRELEAHGYQEEVTEMQRRRGVGKDWVGYALENCVSTREYM